MSEKLVTLDDFMPSTGSQNMTLDDFAPSDPVTPVAQKERGGGYSKYILVGVIVVVVIVWMIWSTKEHFTPRTVNLTAIITPRPKYPSSSKDDLYVGSTYTTRLSEKLSWRPVEAQEMTNSDTRVFPGRLSVGTTESFLECEAKVNGQPSLVAGSAVWYPDGECTARCT